LECEFTGTGLNITFEFFLTAIIYLEVNTVDVLGPVGISFEALTIYGGLTELAFYLNLWSKFFNALYFLIF
jgi:hypothetical protein